MSGIKLTSDTLAVSPSAGEIEYNGQFFGTDSTNSRAQIQRLVRATAQASTSGTSVNFTDIPSWVKRITVMFNGVSTSGTSIAQIQLGSGSFTTTGYFAAATNDATGTTISSGFPINETASAAAETRYGAAIFSLLSGNTWTCTGTLHTPSGNAPLIFFAGGVTLGGTLDRLRITTVNGTDTFDAGSINIMYEG